MAKPLISFCYFCITCMIELDVEIDGVEYIKLNYKLVYSNPALVIVFLAALVIVLGSVFMGRFSTGNLTSSPVLIIALIIIAYLLILLPITLFYRVKHLYNTMPVLHEKLRYTINEQQVIVKGKTVKEKNVWKDYATIKQTKNWVILWKAKNMGTFIPKSAFKNKDELERLFQFATSGGVQVR